MFQLYDGRSDRPTCSAHRCQARLPLAVPRRTHWQTRTGGVSDPAALCERVRPPPRPCRIFRGAPGAHRTTEVCARRPQLPSAAAQASPYQSCAGPKTRWAPPAAPAARPAPPAAYDVIDQGDGKKIPPRRRRRRRRRRSRPGLSARLQRRGGCLPGPPRSPSVRGLGGLAGAAGAGRSRSRSDRPVVFAGAGGGGCPAGGNDFQWCFSQVKGAIDEDVAEGEARAPPRPGYSRAAPGRGLRAPRAGGRQAGGWGPGRAGAGVGGLLSSVSGPLSAVLARGLTKVTGGLALRTQRAPGAASCPGRNRGDRGGAGDGNGVKILRSGGGAPSPGGWGRTRGSPHPALPSWLPWFVPP
ncbi:hypothetical protein P7K49_024701 [Saguinus oedipus]|uniref:Uncharacterized protein n=1 Tax=Saguinus oedipus TaxID=9490 RepID=A0ABQ9UR09_SAGOE|nr:hypothetical protein P7K49_024701 [Saguinus oedipus]